MDVSQPLVIAADQETHPAFLIFNRQAPPTLRVELAPTWEKY
jgi:hypothetical protein